MATTDTTNTTEIFGRRMAKTVSPITADMCTIVWSGPSGGKTTAPEKVILGVTNINISYQQQVVRRRTLAAPSGSPIAVIYPTQPVGSIQIQRLYADLSSQVDPNQTKSSTTGFHDIFDLAGWNVCRGTAELTINFRGSSAYDGCAVGAPGYRATGAIVTSYNISAEAEGLTVVDNVSIEFLQLFRVDVPPGK